MDAMNHAMKEEAVMIARNHGFIQLHRCEAVTETMTVNMIITAAIPVLVEMSGEMLRKKKKKTSARTFALC